MVRVSCFEMFYFLLYKIKNKIRMDHFDKYESLLSILNEPIEIAGKKYLLVEELEKFYANGNKRAGTRIRKIMQNLKTAAQNIREDVQDCRKKI